MEKLTPSEIKFIHDTLIENYGGLAGEKDPGMIEYVCQKPFSTVFGYERYPDIFEKAANIMYSLIRGHYFADGNKRTAVMTAYVFLMKNGYWLAGSTDDLFEVCLNVAVSKMTEEQLVNVLKENSQKIEGQ